MEKPYLSGNLKLDEPSLKKAFLCGLNHTYSVLLHLAGQLPQLAEAVCYGDLHNVVEELSADVKVQLGRLDEVFFHLKEAPAGNGSVAALEKFRFLTPEYGYEPADGLLSDLAFVFYLQRVAAVQTSCFCMLRSMAHTLNNSSIKQCLLYNFDDCTANQLMLTLVAKEYMESNINNFI